MKTRGHHRRLTNDPRKRLGCIAMINRRKFLGGAAASPLAARAALDAAVGDATQGLRARMVVPPTGSGPMAVDDDYHRRRLSFIGSDRYREDRRRQQQTYKPDLSIRSLRSVSPAVKWQIEADAQAKREEEFDRWNALANIYGWLKW